jgi:hypothetical protein
MTDKVITLKGIRVVVVPEGVEYRRDLCTGCVFEDGGCPDLETEIAAGTSCCIAGDHKYLPADED